MRVPALGDTLALHVAALRQEGKSGKTEDGYRFVLTLYATWLRESMGVPATVAALTPELIRRWAAWLVEDGRSGNTSRHYQMLLKAHAAWLTREKVLRADPLGAIHLPRYRHKEPVVLEDDEVARLVGACYGTPNPLRNRAALLVLAETGVRVSGLCGLTLDDVTIHKARPKEGEEAGCIRVTLKGGDEITLGFGKDTAQAITQYLALERQAVESRALFLSYKGNPINPKAIDHVLDVVGAAAGITDKPVSAHKLRHYAATNWAAAGMNAFQIARQLGHRNVATSQLYVHLGQRKAGEFYSVVDRLKLPAAKPRRK